MLGLPLAEIKSCLKHGPSSLEAVLVQQQRMIEEKRRQLDSVVSAIKQAMEKLQAGQADWDAIVGVIEVMKMEQNTEWVKKYLNDEQLSTMQELGAESYSDEAKKKMAEWPAWTEADQEKANAQWKHIGDESEPSDCRGKKVEVRRQPPKPWGRRPGRSGNRPFRFTSQPVLLASRAARLHHNEE